MSKSYGKYRSGPGPNCAVTLGWPKTGIGYPSCDTATGSQLALIQPNYYEYCCPPSPVPMSLISGIERRKNYRNNAPRPRGIHSYYNMMWDGRVKRGDPMQQTLQQKKEEEECEKIRQRLSRPRKEVSQKKMRAARSFRSIHPDEAYQQEVFRYATLGLTSMIPKEPKRHYVDLANQVDQVEDCYKGKRWKPLREFPPAPCRAENLVDSGTQVCPNEFYLFEEQAKEIIEKLLGSVLDEAQMELLLEEEYETLQTQQQNHETRMQAAQERIEKFQERDRLRAAEERRLLEAELKLKECEDEVCSMYNLCAFSVTLTKDAIHCCMEQLRRERYLADMPLHLIDRHFLPWLNSAVLKELQYRRTGHLLLNDIISSVAQMRKKDYAKQLSRTSYLQYNFPGWEYDLDERENSPRTPEASLKEGDSDEDYPLSSVNYFSTNQE